ncbi:MAG: leucine-rich repeat domain-containing protein [Lachnospiraceae bacterium]|nr:leucine-rich repeat domain-containing protein [Lachnospiraceae bacterium]
MKSRAGKQLLACMLALAMFLGNVDAAVAAPAAGEIAGAQVAAGGSETGAVQVADEGVQYTVDADGRVTMTPAAAPADDEDADTVPAGKDTDPAGDEKPEDASPAAGGSDPTDDEESGDAFSVTAGSGYAASDNEEIEAASHAGSDTLLPVSDEEEPERLTTVANGTENGLAWTLDENGTLTITGDGSTNDYTQSSRRPSWDGHKTDIKKVFIDMYVRKIGNYAFYNYTSLESVEFSAVSNLRTFGSNVFQGCTKLASIGTYATTEPDAELLEGILPSVTIIGDNMFNSCAITQITIPADVETIDNNAFFNCKALQIVYFSSFGDGSHNLTTIGNNAFSNCESLGQSGETILLPDSVTSIGNKAFYQCTALQRIQLPSGISTIPDNCFTDDEALGGTLLSSPITIPANVTSIGQAAFSGCDILETVTFEDNSRLESIATDAFYNCQALKNITLPASLKTIGGGAFATCVALDENFTIPAGVTSIGKMAFFECGALTQVTVPAGVQTIEESAFAKCSSLATLTWAADAQTTTIKTSAFENCTKLATVTLPASLEMIQTTAFKADTSLTSITIPKACTFLDGSAFDGCTALAEINVEEDNTAYYSEEGIVYKKADGTQHIKPPANTAVIPEVVVYAEEKTDLTTYTVVKTVKCASDDNYGAMINAYLAIHRMDNSPQGQGFEQVPDRYRIVLRQDTTFNMGDLRFSNDKNGDDGPIPLAERVVLELNGHTLTQENIGSGKISNISLAEIRGDAEGKSKIVGRAGNEIMIYADRDEGQTPMSIESGLTIEGGAAVTIRNHGTVCATVGAPIRADSVRLEGNITSTADVTADKVEILAYAKKYTDDAGVETRVRDLWTPVLTDGKITARESLEVDTGATLHDVESKTETKFASKDLIYTNARRINQNHLIFSGDIVLDGDITWGVGYEYNNDSSGMQPVSIVMQEDASLSLSGTGQFTSTYSNSNVLLAKQHAPLLYFDRPGGFAKDDEILRVAEGTEIGGLAVADEHMPVLFGIYDQPRGTALFIDEPTAGETYGTVRLHEAAVRVTVYDPETQTQKQRVFTSLDGAFEDLAKGADSFSGGFTGTYYFYFYRDAVLNRDATLPDYVTYAVFGGDDSICLYDDNTGEAVDTLTQTGIDLNGHTLTGTNLTFDATAIPYNGNEDERALLSGTDAQGTTGYVAFRSLSMVHADAPFVIVTPDGTQIGRVDADGKTCSIDTEDHPYWEKLLANTDVSAVQTISVLTWGREVKGFHESLDYSAIGDDTFTADTVVFALANFRLPKISTCRRLQIMQGARAAVNDKEGLRVTHQLLVSGDSALLLESGDKLTVKKEKAPDDGAFIFTDTGSLLVSKGATADLQRLGIYIQRESDGTAHVDPGHVYVGDNARLAIDELQVQKVNAADAPVPVEFHHLNSDTGKLTLEKLQSVSELDDLCGTFDKSMVIFTMPDAAAVKAINAGFVTVVNADPTSPYTTAGVYGDGKVRVERTHYTMTVGAGTEVGYTSPAELFAALAAVNEPAKDVVVTCKYAVSGADIRFPKAAKSVRFVGVNNESGDKRSLIPNNRAITTTCDTTFENVILQLSATSFTAVSSLTLDDTEVRWNGSSTAKVTVKSGALSCKGEVTFNTPVIFDGSGKASFILDDGEGASLTTGSKTAGSWETKYRGYNDYSQEIFYSIEPRNKPFESFIEGGLQNFAEVRLKYAKVCVRGADAGSQAPVFSGIGTLALNNAILTVADTTARPGALKITDLTADNAVFVADGALSVTDMRLGNQTEVAALGDFKVAGDIICRADGYPAILTTVQATKNGAVAGPKLTIGGTVELQGRSFPVMVMVLDEQIETDGHAPVYADLLSGEPGSTARKLVTAPKAAENCFLAFFANVADGDKHRDPLIMLDDPTKLTDTYYLTRNKNDIFVESGDSVEVALARGILADETALQGAAYINYYKSFKEAVAAVDALKDPAAAYTLVLLQDINKAGGVYAPTALTMPAQASALEIMSADADKAAEGVQPHVLCFSGNLTLKQDTTLNNVKLAPKSNATTDNKNASLAAGRYALTMERVSTESADAPIASITGAKEGQLIVKDEFAVAKNVSGFASVDLSDNLFLTGGAFTADTLILRGDAQLIAMGGAVTVTDVCTFDGDDAESSLHGIAFTKSNKGAGKSNLTIKGEIRLESRGGDPLVLMLCRPTVMDAKAPAVTKEALALTTDPNKNYKVVLDAKNHLADIGTNPTERIRLWLNDGEGPVEIFTNDPYTPVKANGGLYLADTNKELFKNSCTILQSTGWGTSEYPDYAQAVAEIDRLGSKENMRAYVVMLAAECSNRPERIKDLNVTDTAEISPFVLPKKDKAQRLQIRFSGSGATATEVCFTGKLSGYGKIDLATMVLRPCKSATSDAAGTFDVTLGLNSNNGASEFYVSAARAGQPSVPMLADGATIGKITGVKAVAGKNAASKVKIKGGLLTLGTGFAGGIDVELDGSTVVARGASDIGTLWLSPTGQNANNIAEFYSYGALKVADIHVKNYGVSAEGRPNVLLAGRDSAKGGQITLAGKVTAEYTDDDRLPILLIDTAANASNAVAANGIDLNDVSIETASYAGKKLLLAPTADAAMILAWPYLKDADISSYKTADLYVACGKKADMAARIEAYDTGALGSSEYFDPDQIVMTTYAGTFYEAMQIIDKMNRPDYSYSVELLQPGAMYTGKPDEHGRATFGAISLASKTGMLKIWAEYMYDEADPDTATPPVLQFSGALTAKVPTILDLNYIKTECGRMENGGFVADPAGPVLDTGAANKDGWKLKLQGGSFAVTGVVRKTVQFSSLKGTGGLFLEEIDVVCDGAVNLTDLVMDDAALTVRQGDVVVKSRLGLGRDPECASTLTVEDPSKKITLGSVLYEGNLYGTGFDLEEDERCCLTVDYRFTKAATPVSGLTITGDVEDTCITLVPQLWHEAAEGHDAGWYLLADQDAQVEGEDPTPELYNCGLFVKAPGDLVAAKRLAALNKASAGSFEMLMGTKTYCTPDPESEDNETVSALLKQSGGLFWSDLAPVVHVSATAPAYEGDFLTLEEAAKEVDKFGRKEGGAYVTEVTYTLLDHVGIGKIDDKTDELGVPAGVTPPAKIALPEAVKSLTIDGNGYKIAFTGNALALTCDTVFTGGEALWRAKQTGGGYTIDEPYDISLGRYTLTIDTDSGYYDFDEEHELYYVLSIGKISGTGSLIVGEDREVYVARVSVKDLTLLEDSYLETPEGNIADISVTGNLRTELNSWLESGGKLTVGGDTTLLEDSGFDTSGDVTLKGALLMGPDSSIETWYNTGSGITVKGRTTMECDAELDADGKLTLGDVVLDMGCDGEDSVFWDAGISPATAKDPHDSYMITVNGTIRTAVADQMPVPGSADKDAPIRIGEIRTPNKTALVTAPKAADGWFRPEKLDPIDKKDAEDSWGNAVVYKSGSRILFEQGKELPVRLFTHGDEVNRKGEVLQEDDPVDPDDPNSEEYGSDGYGISSDFASWDEAVKEIDKLAVTATPAAGVVLDKGVKLPYARNDLILMKETIDIVNAQGKPAALTLPAKTSQLSIAADESLNRAAVTFAGGVTLKSDLTVDPAVSLVSVKQVTVGKAVNTMSVAANYTLGVYDLTIRGTTPPEQGESDTCVFGEYTDVTGLHDTIGNVTATAGKGHLILEADAVGDYPYCVKVSGNLTADVVLGQNTYLKTTGAATVPTLVFDRATKDQNAPVLDALGALTLGVAQQVGSEDAQDTSGCISRPLSAPAMTIKGVKKDGRMIAVDRDPDGDGVQAAPVEILLGEAEAVSADTKVLTGPAGMSVSDWKISNGKGSVSYNPYLYKNAIYAGEAVYKD